MWHTEIYKNARSPNILRPYLVILKYIKFKPVEMWDESSQ
jgi:hypothetical protein